MSDFLQRLHAVCAERQKEWAEGDVEPLFFATEFGGEAGEILNEVKKLERERRGWRGSRTTVDKLGTELGDGLITLVNLANVYGINLEDVATAKFNESSAKNDLPHRV